MKKLHFCFLLLILVFSLTMNSFAGVNSKSRNKIDSIKITKITPRSLSCLLKPVNMPVNLEILYNLKSSEKGKVVIYFYKVYRKGIAKKLDIKEIKQLRQVYEVKKGEKSISYSSKPIKIGKDEKIYELYTATSLVDEKNKEVAFSTSKNIISGTYEIVPGKKTPTKDFIRQIAIKPGIGSQLVTGKTTDFQITLQYSLKSKPMAFVVVTFADVSELGTGLCWHSSTFSVPRGQGKLIIKPRVFLAKNLSQKNMGIGISYWLNPLKNSITLLRVVDYFLR